MARLTDKELIRQLFETHDKRVLDAFLDSVADIRDAVVIRELVRRIEAGDIEGALEALHLDPEAFARLELAIGEAYNGGGQGTVQNLPAIRDDSGNRVIFRWNVRNQEAEAWLRDHSAALVTRIVDDQRTAIRTALADGLEQGRNPRNTALDVVGRIDRGSNRRKGGIIGLTAPQERFVASARAELSSGDETALQHYLTRERRDRRFDRTIMKAIREGKPLPAEVVNRITGRYADRLLQLRGEMLAQHETFLSLQKGKHDAYAQQIAAGKIDVRDVTKTWKHTPQENPRMQHVKMNGQAVPFGEPFIAPDGTRIQYPHAPGIPASHALGCKCQTEYRIDFTARLVRQRAA